MKTDRKPWYRQFWPWFLIALPGSVVVASLVTVVVAVRHEDSLVSDNYYKKGLAINLERSRDERAVDLALQAQIAVVERDIGIELAGSLGEAPASLTLSFMHPLQAQRDFDITLRRSGESHYEAALPRALDGRWYIELSDPAQNWRLRGEVRADAGRQRWLLEAQSNG